MKLMGRIIKSGLCKRYMNSTASAETKEIKKIIGHAKDIIIARIPKENLISIYIGGRILTKDRSPSSDIDLYTIVADGYDVEQDKRINRDLAKLSPERKCEIKSFFLSDLEGRTQGKTSLFGDWKTVLNLHLKSFRNKDRHLLWGQKIDFRKLPIESLSDHEELRFEIEGCEKAIRNIEDDGYSDQVTSFGTTNMQFLTKQVLHVARMETIISRRITYESSFHGIEKRLKGERKHMFHDAQRIRKEDTMLSTDQKKAFIKKVRVYLDDVRSRLL